MTRLRRTAAAVALCWLGGPVTAAQVSDDVVRIGFVTDLSGPYKEIDGPAGGQAIRMAVEDLGGLIAGKRVEVLLRDHKNDAALAGTAATELLDQGVDVIIGGVASPTSLAMAKLAQEKRKPFIAVGAGTTVHTNEQCSPWVVHYAYDTAAQGKVAGGGTVRAGGKTWFFITAEYPFGKLLQDSSTAAVKTAGGEIVGAVTHARGIADFASFLRQAEASKAEVLGLGNTHADLTATLRTMRETGLGKGMKLSSSFFFINELHDIGLDLTQGMLVSDSWYWNRDAETRAWSRRFFDQFNRMPSSLQAASYSAALHYLKAVQATGSDDPATVLSAMRATKINDMYAKNGFIREDGRMVHDMYLLRVKAPARSTEPWDYYDIVETVAGEAAWTTKSESKCALWK